MTRPPYVHLTRTGLPRPTGLFCVVCLCGAPVEWSDTSRETVCPHCRRVLVVEMAPGAALTQVRSGGRA